MISSEKRNLSFGNCNNASFSSYLNGNGTEESFVLKLTQSSHQNLNSLVPKNPPQQQAFIAKKKVEDGEIGIFGAEKYFKGAIDMEDIPRIPNKPNSMNHQELKDEPVVPKAQSATPSIQSESSWNSRSGLLHTAPRTRSGRDRNKGNNSTVKSLFTSLGCHCNDKNSVKITEYKSQGKEIAKHPEKAGDLARKTISRSSRWAEEDVHGKNLKREECFSFPVLNSKAVKMEVQEDGEKDPTRNSLEVFGSPILEKGKKSFSLERKLTMLNWDGVTPRVENLDISKHGNNDDDAESDASSDLFEIESFSTNGNSFLARQVSGRDKPLTNGYAPSEASIEWSVATASVADFSTASDYQEISATARNYSNANRNTRVDMEKRGPGILSGCKSLKSVRVAGDKNWTSGDKVVVQGIRERSRVDFVMPIAKFQAETKLLTGFDSRERRGQHGYDARSHSPRASHHLYIQ